MSQIERIKELPDWAWSPHSAKEIVLNGKELVNQTDIIWRIGNAAVCGFIYTSFLSPPWLWFILAAEIYRSDLIDLRRLCTRIPSGTLTAIEDGYSAGVKFARFYGFEETETRVDHKGFTYVIYRRK